MGTNLKSTHFPNEVKQALLKVFSELKQTVLWKFEENIPNLPKNVHILEWAPQQSILGKNRKFLFSKVIKVNQKENFNTKTNL